MSLFSRFMAARNRRRQFRMALDTRQAAPTSQPSRPVVLCDREIVEKNDDTVSIYRRAGVL
ncbi:MAG: hypothetical protein ACREVL_14270 [Solimonas sp.]